MDANNTAVAESSPAAVQTPPAEPAAAPKSKTFDMPRSGPERDAFLKSGTMPGEPKADSTPAKGSLDTGSDSGTDKTKQEAKAQRPIANAETRLNELMADLKKAGLTPAELKTFKREQQQAAAPASEPKPASSPAEAPKPPQFAKPEPELKDFDDVAEFVKAHGKWTVESYEFQRNQREQQSRLDADVKAMRTKAAERYGPDYEAPLKHAAEQIFTKDAGAVPAVIKQMFNDSDVLPDLLYTLGTKTDDLNSFVELAKSDPGKAIRKLVIMENLIREELAKPKAQETEGQTERDESGKFVAAKDPPAPPAKKTTNTPPPPREASGTGSAPPDELAAAYKRVSEGNAGPRDFETIQRLENARDLANKSRRR